MFLDHRLVGVEPIHVLSVKIGAVRGHLRLLAHEHTLVLLRGMVLATNAIRAVAVQKANRRWSVVLTAISRERHLRLAKVGMAATPVELSEEYSVAHCLGLCPLDRCGIAQLI